MIRTVRTSYPDTERLETDGPEDLLIRIYTLNAIRDRLREWPEAPLYLSSKETNMLCDAIHTAGGHLIADLKDSLAKQTSDLDARVKRCEEIVAKMQPTDPATPAAHG